MMVSDRGSNEVGSRNIWLDVLATIPFVFFLDSDCFEHALHLIVLGGLTLIDFHLKHHRNWKYYSTLAILSNVLRDIATDIYDTWARKYDVQSANDKVKSLFPKANSARWGQIHNLEGRLRNAGIRKIEVVLSSVLEGKNAKRHCKRAANPNPDLNPNAFALEQTKEFTVRQGKWRTHAEETSKDPLLAASVDAMFVAREPIMRMSNFIKQKITDSELDKYGGKLAQIVNFKAQSINEDLDALFTSSLALVICELTLYFCLDNLFCLGC